MKCSCSFECKEDKQILTLETSKLKVLPRLSVPYLPVLKPLGVATDLLPLKGIYNPKSRALQSVGTGSAAINGFSAPFYLLKNGRLDSV